MLSGILCAETTRKRKAKNLTFHLFRLLSCTHPFFFFFFWFVPVNISMKNKLHFILNLYRNAAIFRILLTIGSERTYERNPVKKY